MPGPLKLNQRCRDKIAGDYEGTEAWPPAASLFDIVRCCVVLDDPYAMAVLIAYFQKRFAGLAFQIHIPGNLKGIF